MSVKRRYLRSIPPLLLTAVVGTVAAAVDRYASPPGGLQLPHAASQLDSCNQPTKTDSPYPHVTVDTEGIRVQILRPPKRIASQALSLEEFTYRIAPPESVVAVSAYASNKGMSNVAELTERFHPIVASDPERVVRVAPDLVLVSSTARADYTSLLRSTGIPTVRVQTRFATLEQVAETIRTMGYLLGEPESAAREEQRFRAAINDAIAMRGKSSKRPRVLGLSGQFALGNKTLFNDVVVRLGGENLAASAGVKGIAEVSSESIARWNPDWIVTGCDVGAEDATRARMLRDPAIAMTSAARSRHILVFENRVFGANSPFVTSLVSELAKAIYSGPKSAENQ